MNFMNSIGCKICNLRKQNNMSQEQLAEMLNVSRQSVSKWERDEALPDIYNLEAVSDVFGITIDSLVRNNADEISSCVLPIYNSSIGQKNMKHKANSVLAVAIGLYIYTFLLMITINYMERVVAANIFIVLFIFLVSFNSGLLAYHGLLIKRQRKYQNSQNDNTKSKSVIIRPILTNISIATALLLFMIIVLLFQKWHPAWIVFPIAAVTIAAVNIIGKKDAKEYNDYKPIDKKHNKLLKKFDILFIVAIALTSFSIILAIIFSVNITTKAQLTNYLNILAAIISINAIVILYTIQRHKKIKPCFISTDENNKTIDIIDDRILGVFSCIALIIFLVSCFVFEVWHPTWIVLPVSGLLALIVNKIKNNKAGKKADKESMQTNANN